jgi:hypothetical protein
MRKRRIKAKEDINEMAFSVVKAATEEGAGEKKRRKKPTNRTPRAKLLSK